MERHTKKKKITREEEQTTHQISLLRKLLRLPNDSTKSTTRNLLLPSFHHTDIATQSSTSNKPFTSLFIEGISIHPSIVFFICNNGTLLKPYYYTYILSPLMLIKCVWSLSTCCNHRIRRIGNWIPSVS